MRKILPIILFLSSVAIFGQNLSTDGLVLYYPFDGAIVDMSGLNNQVTNTGVLLTTDQFGNANSAALFDGVDDLMYMANNSSLQVEYLTIAVWIYPTKINGAIINKNNWSYPTQLSFILGQNLEGGGVYRTQFFQNTQSGCEASGPDGSSFELAQGIIPLNQWSHLAATYDGVHQKIYLNGSLVGTKSKSGPILNCSGRLNIGGWWSNDNKAYKGKMDDLRMYNRALSASEISLLYLTSISPLPISIPMITIPSGTFTMGCTSEQTICQGDENPAHSITLSSYTIGKFEVTQKEWRTVMGTNPSEMPGDNRPVERVSWYGIISFCNTLSTLEGLTPVYTINGSSVTTDWNANGYRLPTEAEWEYAARGGQSSINTIYSGSDIIGDVAWYSENAGGVTHDVGTKTANQLGIHDMSGNVWEWCWDWYSSSYYTSSSQVNPAGPNSGTTRVMRGGSWHQYGAEVCRVARRSYGGPDLQGGNVGFRLARTVQTTVSTGEAWQMQINTTVQSLFDQLNNAGVDSLATEGFDQELDTPNPPTPPGSYIDAYFYHPEWNSPLGAKFASDVKQSTDLADTVKRWFFEVETNVLNDTVKLQFTQENVPGKFGKYLTDMQTGKRVDLRYTDTYKYYNTSTSPRKFQLIIGDSTSPVISNLIPKGDEIWRSNTNKTVSWTMSDGTGIDTVFLYSSNNNGANFNRFASIGNISNYNWSIPQEYLNNGYRVKTVVRDSLGNESEIISPLAFTVVGDSLLTQSYAGWNLTGTPLLPNDTTLAGILGDDIVSSPYFVWAYSLSTGYTIPLGLSFGTGYWLGLLNNHTWDVRGTAVESDSTGQSLNLGYNLISTKYVREVSKDRMTFVKSGTSYSFNSAVTAGLISNAIFAYNGNGYTEEDTLSLFGGYWLGVLQEGVTLHQKPVSTQLPISKGNQEPELLTEKNWKLRLNAESGIQSDNITEIGVTETATAGYDTDYDAARPPVPPVDKFIEIYSEVSGPGYPQFLGNRYARDFKNTPNWTIKVKKGITRSNEVTINWNRNELGNLPYGMRITMTDLTTGQTIDMRRDSSYTFTYTEERTFLINGTATGIEDAATAPTDFSLSQNYPNPFNPSTKIRYSLPEESRVKITVYNSLGEMVKIMTNETAQRGWYETTFDATAIPSGIYFAKIETQSLQSSKQFIQTIKMLLIK